MLPGQPVAPQPRTPAAMEARAAGYLLAVLRMRPYFFTDPEYEAVFNALYWDAMDLRACARIERCEDPRPISRRRSAA